MLKSHNLSNSEITILEPSKRKVGDFSVHSCITENANVLSFYLERLFVSGLQYFYGDCILALKKVFREN